jgi:hypothetical protein
MTTGMTPRSDGHVAPLAGKTCREPSRGRVMGMVWGREMHPMTVA